MSEVLQSKLMNYQAQPPEKTWEKINTALDEEYSGSIGERLYNFQAAPNEEIWNKISLQLQPGAEDSKKTYPVSQGRSSLFRYLSAAAILILIASGIFLFINNRTDSDVVNNTTEVPGNSSIDTNTSEVTGTGENQIKTESGKINPSGSKQNNTGVAKKTSSGNNRYMMLTTDRGNTVRVSKKLYAVFDCADNATALNSKRCKENIQTLQRKMASAVVTPTNDFTSVIDMIKTLEKEQ
jgi:hypothetical protein